VKDVVFADVITNVSYAHGALRVSLGRQAGDQQIEDAGTLVLPISQAGQFVSSLAGSLKQLETKVREAQEQQRAEATDATPAPESGDGKELHFGD
jgi:hypothetical protein